MPNYYSKLIKHARFYISKAFHRFFAGQEEKTLENLFTLIGIEHFVLKLNNIARNGYIIRTLAKVNDDKIRLIKILISIFRGVQVDMHDICEESLTAIVPSPNNKTYNYEDMHTLAEYMNSKDGDVQILLGRQPAGTLCTHDLSHENNILIGGATGSGKSMLLHGIIMSLRLKYGEQNISIILFDAKKVEFIGYIGDKFLQDISLYPEELGFGFQVIKMIIDDRRRMLVESRSRDYISHNKKMQMENRNHDLLLPIIVIMDEINEIWRSLKGTVSEQCKNMLIEHAGSGRALGISFIVATQRPDSSMLDRLTNQNMFTRVSFYLPSHYDSQAVLGMSGAQKLNSTRTMYVKKLNTPELIEVRPIFFDQSTIYT
ncbi:FtsK/SpoIIIE domain-containing protein [Fundidesulfovibrio soli]|uniref:FtsK/SpoIIIE domain-containing protein n=1 Tax=Fundidesulfovibrio soli TaxID=2922716 RepID=UPI001FAF5707|nr:FtsK/SpoIIIE domain-containing protein [Fundidesulfovibrio soli]